MTNDKDRVLLVKVGAVLGVFSIMFSYSSDEAFDAGYVVTGITLAVWTVIWIALAIWCSIGAAQND